MHRRTRIRLLGLLTAVAMLVPASGALASTTPTNGENRYKLTVPNNGSTDCDDSGGRSAGQYANDCYLP